MAIKVLNENELEARRALMKQREWIKSVLANDTVSSQSELIEYFEWNGLTPAMARYWAAKRNS